MTTKAPSESVRWITARELHTRRGGSLRAAQLLIADAEATGWGRVRTEKSRRGRPTKLLALEDYDAMCAGELPQWARTAA